MLPARAPAIAPTVAAVQSFEAQAARNPHAAAVACGSEAWTMQELDRRAESLARRLRAAGVGPGVPVGVLLPRSAGLVEAQLAVWKAGGVHVPLDPELPDRRIVRMLEECAARVTVTDRSLLERAAAHPAAIVVRDVYPAGAHDGRPAPVAHAPDDPAYIIYTSGSQGVPKAVVVARASLDLYVDTLGRELPVGPGDVCLYTASAGFSAAIRQTMLPLCAGAALVVADSEQQRNPRRLLRLMRDRGVTVWDTVPTVWRLCVDALRSLPANERGELLANRLRRITVTGEPLHWDLPQAWMHELGHGAEIVNLYSQTETSGTVCLHRVPRECAGESGWVPLGRPVDGVELELLDEAGRLTAPGEVGEIVVGGARVARGYLNAPGETDRCFAHDVGGRGGDALRFRTGDLASRRADGVLEPRGRADDRLKLGGQRVEPGEVEAALAAHPGIGGAAVRPYAAEGGDVRLVAYLVPSGCCDIGAEAVRAFLAERLPAYMIPSAFLTVDALPRTPSGKLDRSGLPLPSRTRAAGGEGAAHPRNAIEQSILEIWREALAVDAVGVRDSFMSLGGHSLSAMRVVSRLYETFGLDVSVRELFDAGDVTGLSELVAQRLRSGQPAGADGAAAD